VIAAESVKAAQGATAKPQVNFLLCEGRIVGLDALMVHSMYE
jgi:hypothetical protein